MEKKLLALDLDGTTFGEHGVLSPGNRRALEAARGAGAVVCFVSGRKNLRRIEHITGLADYILLNNGGTLLKMPQREQVYTTLVRRRDLERLLAFCNSHDVMLHMIRDGYWGINLVRPELPQLERRYQNRPVLYRSADDLPFETVDGFVTTGHSDLVQEFVRREGLDLHCMVSDPLTMDVMPGQVNKWYGAWRVAQLEGIPRERVIGAGNYYNDLELILGAGTGVAVRNAPADLQAQADYVTARTNLEDAVAEIVERFILGREGTA
ncbi:MAG TPA: HAD hydrolase family protein [Candidatus Anaerotruncus excrementipullorum]|uniref:HAD hydrolase family protein n=1 Tax=Candidatus Anaerotruncus excrementipullorum TaxID=2838465 RepID=A0A9D1WRX8_9FIRM|nr:HAD hydrolase family protein [Candidatus Anaerotruncus excrementipullorum]